jgi:hypothetical protein
MAGQLQDAVFPDPTVSSFPSVNTISLAGQVMAGKWELVDAQKVFGWQIQKGFGLSGAFAFPIGDELVVPKFLVTIWKQFDFLQFREQRKLLLKKPVFSVGGTLTSKALGVTHPELKALGVTDVVVKSLGPMVNDLEKGGLWTCTVEFLQWRKPILALPRPAGTIPDNGPPQPTAVDAQDKELQALRAERAALAGPP